MQVEHEVGLIAHQCPDFGDALLPVTRTWRNISPRSTVG